MQEGDREKYVNSMVDVHLILKKLNCPLQLDTLFLAVNLFDRFLSIRIVAREKLTLLMLTCFYLSAKFEDTNYPLMSDLLTLVKDAGSKDDMLMMERVLLKKLDFRLGLPTAYTFLRRYVHCCECENTVGLTSRFICELSLLDYTITICYPPSMIAASCLALALRINGKIPWTATLVYYSHYTYEDLRPCMIKLRDLVKKAPLMKYQTTFLKYSGDNYLRVARIAYDNI